MVVIHTPYENLAVDSSMDFGAAGKVAVRAGTLRPGKV